MQIRIEQLGPDAPYDDLAQFYDVSSSVYFEDFPGHRIPSREAFVEQMRMPTTPVGPRRSWVARAGGSIVGIAMVYFLPEENDHAALANVRVLPSARRQGIGAGLLRATLPAMRAENRRVVFGRALKSGSTGDRWARGLGFRKVNELAMQSLEVNDATAALWHVPAPVGYRIVKWTGPAPDDLVADYARARTAISEAPLGELRLAHPEWTVERVRQYEANARAAGTEVRVVVAVHEETGEVAGLTTMQFRLNEDEQGYQGDTAVLPGHRGHGLGRFMKAEMMRWIRAERPEMRKVTTHSASTNEHMIRVNRQLGYTVDMVLTDLEADLDQLSAGLR